MNTRLTIVLQNASARNIDNGCEITLNDVVVDQDTLATVYDLMVERDIPRYIADATAAQLGRMLTADTIASRMLP